MTTHPIVDRLAAQGADTLSALQVADVLGCKDRMVYTLLKKGSISNLTQNANGGKNFRHTITPAAVLLYLVKVTCGDKTDLLEAIKIRFPQHHAMCKAAAEGKQPDAPLPVGVVDAREAFTPARKSKPAKGLQLKPLGPGDFYQSDLFDPHMDLTAHPTLIQA